ncbi:hypothetical protein [Nesterenkonia sp. PF2B19]|uniref:hypothetical protein n=1 Tax=Nesterenkonia sp. PF2B19 TaxID=1881858 RepID=UPI000872737E|nr:hypothetical protein [Nesterenkonia sp. PF2B19]OSM43485.1 hypothetical protein BCY76_008175 [Nesterenkonia sp. PF2B19]
MTDRPDQFTEADAKAAVTYLAQIDARVIAAEEIPALAEVWHHGLRKFTPEQVRWGIKHYYGVLAIDKAPVLTAAECRRILITTRVQSEAKRAALGELPKPQGTPMPEELRDKLDRIGGRVDEEGTT